MSSRSVLAGALRQSDRLVLGHGRGGADEVRLVARHEDHARALAQERFGCAEHVELCVAVEREGVVLGHAGFHAAGGVQHEHVETTVFVGDGVEHRRDRRGVGQVGTDDERAASELAQLTGELLGARGLVAEVDDDIRPGLRQVAHGVGADPRDEPVTRATLPSRDPAGRTAVTVTPHGA